VIHRDVENLVWLNAGGEEFADYMVKENRFPDPSWAHENHGSPHRKLIDQRKEKVEVGSRLECVEPRTYALSLPPRILGPNSVVKLFSGNLTHASNPSKVSEMILVQSTEDLT
jgi:hypothetical protein